MGSVDGVELHDLVQGSRLDQLLQLALLAVGGLAVEGLEDDLDLVVVPDRGTGGDDAGDLELCGTVLDNGRVDLRVRRLLEAPAPGEHLVRSSVGDSQDPGAEVTPGGDGLTAAVVQDTRTHPDHVLLLHHMLEHHHRVRLDRSLGVAVLGEEVWVRIITVLIFEEVFLAAEIVWSVDSRFADDSPQLHQNLG